MSNKSSSVNCNISDEEGKKRVNSPSEREASKKVKASEQKDDETDANSYSSKDKKYETMDDCSAGITKDVVKSDDRLMKTRQSENSNPDKRPRQRRGNRVWDLESAILYLVQIGCSADNSSPNNSPKKDVIEQSLKHNDEKPKSIAVNADTDDVETNDSEYKTQDTVTVEYDKPTNTNKTDMVNNKNNSIREYLTKEETSWISFRPAHAGDASTIAQWYRRHRSEDRHNRQKRQKSKSSTTNTSEKETIREDVEQDLEEPEIDSKPVRSSSSNEEEVGCYCCNHSNSNNDIRNEGSKDHLKNFNSSDDAAIEDDDDNRTNDEEDGLSSSSLQLEHWLAEGLGD